MVAQCNRCEMYYNDEFRWTICPHHAFPANNGHNVFFAHEDAYLSLEPPNANLNERSKIDELKN